MVSNMGMVFSCHIIAEGTKREIRKAMRHWRRKTCIQFRQKKDDDKDYIYFVDEPG